jgi:membrane protease YdiL (CAAX protease family)
MFLLFLVAQRIEFGPVKRIQRFLQEALAPPLAACRWYDLILLAAMAGIAEEALFRGLLQIWIEQWARSQIGGLIGSNILFGLAHSVSMTYAGLAGVMGVYLGWLFDATGERNLLTPIITHALYDYLAFLVVVRTYRRELQETADAE